MGVAYNIGRSRTVQANSHEPGNTTTTTNLGHHRSIPLGPNSTPSPWNHFFHYYKRNNALGSTDTLKRYSRRQEGQHLGLWPTVLSCTLAFASLRLSANIGHVECSPEPQYIRPRTKSRSLTFNSKHIGKRLIYSLYTLPALISFGTSASAQNA